MKKLSPLVVLAAIIGFASCKKETVSPAPSASAKSLSLGDLKDYGTWDGRDTTENNGNGLRFITTDASTTDAAAAPATKEPATKKKPTKK